MGLVRWFFPFEFPVRFGIYPLAFFDLRCKQGLNVAIARLGRVDRKAGPAASPGLQLGKNPTSAK